MLSIYVVPAIVCMLSCSVFAATDITLRRAAAPRSTVVRLGDVAEIRANDQVESKRLAAMPLMPTPTAGTPRYLRMREVQDLLAAHGENLEQLNFQGELSVEISALAQAMDERVGHAVPLSPASEKRRSAWLHGTARTAVNSIDADTPASPAVDVREQVKQIIVEYLNGRIGEQAAWNVKFNVAGMDAAQLARATTELKCSGGTAPWTGKQSFVVSFTSADGELQIPISADVSRPQMVAVAVRPIERGGILTGAALELQQWDSLPATAGRRTAVDNIDKLIGMEAVRAIQVGDAIFSDSVRPQLLVKRGDEVVVYARGGGIQVRSLAKAKQDGARGELVQLESLGTRESFDAVVNGPREAVVFAGSATPPAKVAEKPFRRPSR